MTTAFFKKSLIAAAVTLASTQTFAAAFQLNEHSASGGNPPIFRSIQK